MVIFGNRTKDGKIVANFSAASVPGIESGWAVEAILDDRELVVKPRVAKEPEVAIAYGRIQLFALGTRDEILEQRKSVFGRALVGGLVFGPVGAVVGGLDGMVPKRKKTRRTYLSLDVGDFDETQFVVLEVLGATMGLTNFLGELDMRAPWAALSEKKRIVL